MYGSGNYSQANYGTGVAEAHGFITSTSTVNTFGIAQWESTHTFVYSSSVALMFGGIIQGANGLMVGASTMYSHPVFTWAGFETSSEQTTVSTYGYIAWDSQLVSDTTWTTQTIS